MDDRAIVQLYLERNEEAINITAEKYGKKLRSIAYGITEDNQASEECENDTYLAVWNSIPPNKPESYFFAYISRITRHISIDYCRRQNAQKRDAPVLSVSEELESCFPAYDTIEEEINARELIKVIEAFLRTIPKENRIIFLRRYYFCDSISDIAAFMSLKESKIKSSLFRTRKKLHKILEKEGFIL